MLFLTADLHLDHEVCAKLRKCSVEEMNERILAVWNSKVRPKDTVAIVGDVAMKATDNVLRILKALNGTKLLVPGNHDTSNNLKKYAECCTILSRLEVIKTKQMKHLTEGECAGNLCLCHYPLLCWPGDALAYGHLHGGTHRTPFGGIYKNMAAIDVGWDVQNIPLPASWFWNSARARVNC